MVQGNFLSPQAEKENHDEAGGGRNHRLVDSEVGGKKCMAKKKSKDRRGE